MLDLLTKEAKEIIAITVAACSVVCVLMALVYSILTNLPRGEFRADLLYADEYIACYQIADGRNRAFRQCFPKGVAP